MSISSKILAKIIVNHTTEAVDQILRTGWFQAGEKKVVLIRFSYNASLSNAQSGKEN